MVKTTSCMCLAMAVRTLHGSGMAIPQIREFVDGFVALMSEVADKRNTPVGMMNDAYELTGIDVKKEVERAYGGK